MFMYFIFKNSTTTVYILYKFLKYYLKFEVYTIISYKKNMMQKIIKKALKKMNQTLYFAHHILIDI